MKKLLILVLVLSVASAANALVLSLNGDIGAGDNMPEEITVNPSDFFTIDVHSLTTLPDQFWVEILGPASYAGLGNVVTPPAPAHLQLEYYVDQWGEYIHAYMDPPDSTAGIGEWWWLELHCEGEGDVLINLYDSAGMTIIDTAVVHQTPEPMTIALLGLGGLLLRRRKA